MLAYRHAFHAGNHADVLKHMTQALVLRYMAEKDKPYTLIDTHAGAGGYSLQGRYANKNGEYEDGIGKLWGRDDLPPACAEYVTLVKAFNRDPQSHAAPSSPPEGGQKARGGPALSDDGGKLTQYPGSPGIASMLLRAEDRLRLYELHPTDERILRAFLAKRPNTQVCQGDGFAALKGELPTPSRRAVVLIDPPYELKHDYGKTLTAVREALTRFAETVIMVWYPHLQLVESAQLPQRLRATADSQAKKGWLHVRLSVRQPDAKGFGMMGSGLFIINPPFKLHDQLAAELPYLVEHLGQYDGANYLLEQRAV